MGVGVKLMSMFRAGDHENYRHYCASDLGKHAAGRCDNSRPVIARDGGLSLRMGYEKMIALRCGTARDHSLLRDGQELKIAGRQGGVKAGRHGGLPLRRGTVRDRSLRRDGQELKIPGRQGGMKAGRHGGLPLRRGTVRDRSLRKDDQNDSLSIVILNEVKDLGGGKTGERFFAKDAQNDKMKVRFFAKEAQNDKSIRMTFVVVCLMLLLLLVSPVGAQEPTTRLFLNPTPLEIDTTISPTGVVTLEVADGVDIFAFDMVVQYDPALLTVSQVTLGDFLGEGLFCMDQVNDPGLVHYACTRWLVETGVSGSGVLLELTFVANGQPGDSVLSLEGSALYDWPDAFLVDATLEDGAVSVRPYWTYLPLIIAASEQGKRAVR